MIARALPWLTALLATLAFLPALGAGFVNWDDEVTFLANPHYRGLGPTQIQWMLTTTLLGHWSPLTWLTWGANYAVGGLDPFGYHLVNVLLHTVNIALFGWLARALLAHGFSAPPSSPGVVAGAVCAALVFGAHPLRAESVAWLSDRRDVLCATFALAATLAWLRGRRVLSVTAYGAALLSKASVMTVPLVWLLLDIYPLRRTPLGWRALVREKLPHLALAAAAGVVAFATRQQIGGITDFQRYGAEARAALIGHALWFYPSKTVWPVDLAVGYELPRQIALTDPRFLLPALAALAITVALIVLRRRWPAGIVAWAALIVTLLPTSGLIHSGEQFAADRYAYLSCLGLALLAGAALTPAVRRPGWRVAAPALAAVIFIALGVATWHQTGTWRDSETLWRHAVRVHPQCALCESNLGRVIARPGRFAEAEAHIQRALALRPDRPGAHENLGVVLRAQGRHAEAHASFVRVVALRPAHASSRLNLGVSLATLGRDDDAEREFREAERLSPTLSLAPANLGALYLRQQRPDAAIPPLERAVGLDPTRADPRVMLTQAYAMTGRTADAERQIRILRTMR